MKLKTEQCVAAAVAAAPFAILADLVARGADSLYGRFFLWLCRAAS